MQFDLVSPERRLAQAKVTAVQIPGADGDMTAMADHAPTITTLRPGLLVAEGPDGTTEYLVTGGFAEIGAGGVTVLAERAMPRSEVSAEEMSALVKEAEDALAKVKETFVNEPGPVDDAAKLLADMVAAGDQIGFAR
jgi:F-type H+-transporting ATPase subunit epsilon